MRTHKQHTPKTIIYSPFVNSGANVFHHINRALKDGAFLGEQRSFRMRMVHLYYANGGESTKKFIQREFVKKSSTCRILVCTVAFGLGINIPDISNVIHWGCSKNALGYWQEVGRAGRDGRQANAYLYVVPDLYNEKVQDPEFVLKLKKLGGLSVRERSGKGKSRGTQTEESALAEEQASSLGTPDDKPVCLRKFILEELVLAGMKNTDMLREESVCPNNPPQCNKQKCCTFCRDRCTCVSAEIWELD